MISTEGIIVRIAVAEISSFARPAKGVKVMNVGKDGAKVLSVAVAEHSEEDVNATPEAAEADAGDTGSDEAETAEE